MLAVVRWAPGEPGLGHDEIRHARLDARERGLMCAELSDEGAQVRLESAASYSKYGRCE